MKTTPVTLEDLSGVFAVPPLARRADKERSLDLAENDRLVRHMSEGGLTRFLYGGNAFLYHVTLKEYEQLARLDERHRRLGDPEPRARPTGARWTRRRCSAATASPPRWRCRAATRATRAGSRPACARSPRPPG